MKKLITILILLNFIACYAVRYVAPPQKEVKLMSETDVGKVKLTKRVWYAVWGLVPITDNSTEDLISKYNLKNVKAKTYFSFLDYLISVFTSYFTIVTLTIEVEGEPAE